MNFRQLNVENRLKDYLNGAVEKRMVMLSISSPKN